MKIHVLKWMAIAAVLAGGCGSKPNDYASPKSTMRTLMRAIDEGNKQAAADCFLSPGVDQLKMINAMVDYSQSVRKLNDAAKAKYGVVEARPVTMPFTSADYLKRISDAQEKRDSDDKTQIVLKQDGTITLVRTNNQWKIDPACLGDAKAMAVSADRLQAMARTYDLVALQINEGRLATFSAVQSALTAGTLDAIGASSRPATRAAATTSAPSTTSTSLPASQP